MPVSLSVLQKFAAYLQNEGALQSRVQSVSQAAGLSLPGITPGQVILSSAAPDMGDTNLEFTYPRVCLYVPTVRNLLTERFRSFSGTVLAVAEIWASASYITECDQWIHYYLDALAGLLEESRGDWGDGVYFSGIYDAQINAPKAGGFGFVQSAKLSCTIQVSVG